VAVGWLRAWVAVMIPAQVKSTSRRSPPFTRDWSVVSLKKLWVAIPRYPDYPYDSTQIRPGSDRPGYQGSLHRKNSLFFKSTKGAQVADLYMSLIHTCELNRADPFDYLVTLLRHHQAVARAPADWMPWNCEAARARPDRGP
jgi:hypothetical protein